MKKLLSIGLLTVCALAASERPADAWVNSKFSIGLNWHYQSANTSVLWGLWRSGQIPGPEAYGPGGPGVMPGYAPPPQAQPFPFLGSANPNSPQASPQQGAYYQPAQNYQPNYNPQAIAQQQQYYAPYTASPYQAVSYQSGAYNYGYYPSNNYYYPGTSYEAPYYWYGQR